MSQNPDTWNDSQQRAVEQVKVLFPHLAFDERMTWIDRFESWYPNRTECMKDLASSLKPDTNRFDVV